MTVMHVTFLIVGVVFVVLGPIAVIFANPIAKSFQKQGRATFGRQGERLYPVGLFRAVGVGQLVIGSYLIVSSAISLIAR